MMQLPLLFVTRKVRPCAVKLQVRNKYVIQDSWRLEQRLGLLAFRLAGTNFQYPSCMLLNDQRNSSCKDDVLSPVKVDGYELCDDVNLRAFLCDRWCGV